MTHHTPRQERIGKAGNLRRTRRHRGRNRYRGRPRRWRQPHRPSLQRLPHQPRRSTPQRSPRSPRRRYRCSCWRTNRPRRKQRPSPSWQLTHRTTPHPRRSRSHRWRHLRIHHRRNRSRYHRRKLLGRRPSRRPRRSDQRLCRRRSHQTNAIKTEPTNTKYCAAKVYLQQQGGLS